MISDEQMEELRKLKELLDANILTQEEFEEKKNLILGSEKKQEPANAAEVDDNKDTAPSDTNVTPVEKKEPGNQKVDEQKPAINNDTVQELEIVDKTDSNKEADQVVLPNYETPKNMDVPQEKKKPNKTMIIVAVIAAIAILGLLISALGGGSNSNNTGDTTSSDYAEEEEIEEEEPVLESISAEYSGDTEKGTVLDEYNAGITVTGTYDDGTTETISGWTVEEPQTLKSGKTAQITISYENQTCDLEVTCTSVSKKQFKKSCKTISYNSLARNPDKYQDKNIKIYGQIIQVLEGDDNTVNFRIGTKNSGYGSWYDDVFLVEYTYSDGESRYLEDDMVTMWGTYGGTYTYESTGGADITVPLLYAKYIKMGD